MLPSSESVIAAVGLGANLGDRRATFASAVDQVRTLPGTRVTAVANPIETLPVGGPKHQPAFLNAAMLLSTTLAPLDLLDSLHAIERAHGRVRASETRWGPRTLDLDLLVFGAAVIDLPGLTVPHPRLRERRFVLEPLAAIAPDLIVPGLNASVSVLLAQLASARGCASS